MVQKEKGLLSPASVPRRLESICCLCIVALPCGCHVSPGFTWGPPFWPLRPFWSTCGHMDFWCREATAPRPTDAGENLARLDLGVYWKRTESIFFFFFSSKQIIILVLGFSLILFELIFDLL